MDWSEFSVKATEWTELENANPTIVTVVKSLLKMGEDEELQGAAQESIRRALRNQEDNPFGRRGRARVLTTEQHSEVRMMLKPIADGIESAFNDDARLNNFILPHGRSKEDSFVDGAAVAKAFLKSAWSAAQTAAKAGKLDGLLNQE